MSKELPPLATDLLDDEAFLGTFRPSLAAFVQRSLIIGLMTAVVFGPLIGLPPAYWLPIMAFTTLFSAFLFDDYTSWLRHRGDLWHLTSLRLIYENTLEPDQNASVNLADIHATHRKLWKNLRLDLETGQSVMMKYLADPKTIEREIDTARTALMGQIADPLPEEEAEE